MYLQSLILFYFSSQALTSPLALPQGTGAGADSCAAAPLEQKTWTDLKIDDFLVSTAKNYTRTKTNNVQSLAASFGAPNFFCGLDKFCNAGQPCLPIQLPAWYATLAIQNWNNYVNGLNTAITFASSIISLKLSEIVQDVYKDPQDNITPLKNIGGMFSSVLSIIPFTGSVVAVVGAVNSGLGFVLKHATPPVPTDKFLAWSNVAGSMGDVIRDFQRTVSDSTDAILDAEIDNPTSGINEILKGGAFLGVSQNFTQTDLQDVVINAITMNAIGLALQAQKIFIFRITSVPTCTEEASNEFCSQNSDGTFAVSLLLRADGNNAMPQTDISDTLQSKYGMAKEQILKGPTDCFDSNNKQQLTNPFDQGGLPPDPKAPCVFNVLVCSVSTTSGREGIVKICRGSGLDV
ncbi:hypothetical protein GQ44DRAFT_765283 [Phaeosphaeriaceae sp. PMI808]|nr:hypothetical protein GQ44DRAFT_765283 [Phaeosphaeriaceae sp. PMI808]